MTSRKSHAGTQGCEWNGFVEEWESLRSSHWRILPILPDDGISRKAIPERNDRQAPRSTIGLCGPLQDIEHHIGLCASWAGSQSTLKGWEMRMLASSELLLIFLQLVIRGIPDLEVRKEWITLLDRGY